MTNYYRDYRIHNELLALRKQVEDFKSGEVYNAYRSYCMQVGEYIRGTTDFYTALECAGFDRKRSKSARMLLGLQLKSDFLE